MEIRPASLDDINEITEMIREFKGKPVDELLINSEFSRYFTDPAERATLLIKDEVGIQGMAIVNLIHRLGDIQCRVDYVFIRESARGKGYGKLLMNACDEWAWQQGANEIEFTSRPARVAANKLYQSNGYELYETNVYRRKRAD
jgi:GNAT superfamily N-acetyltransferase